MSNPNLKITLAQLNPLMGDILGNVLRIREVYFEADDDGSDLVVFPELCVTGYPLEDMANHPDMQEASRAGLEALRRATAGRGAAMVVGAPVRRDGKIHNAAFAFGGGAVLNEVHKRHLPNYGVFDEKRNFSVGTRPFGPFEWRGTKVGVVICEDAWGPDAAAELARGGAQLLVIVNASPFRANILHTRVLEVVGPRVRETGLPAVYANIVGGQDEVVFDGGSFVLDGEGRRICQMPQWEECVETFDLGGATGSLSDADFPNPLENTWHAMMQGLRDYLHKSGFTDVVLGLSGGIDSAVVAAVAGDALGADRVHCVRLPSQYTTDLSNDTADEMCRIWGFPMHTLPIGEVVSAGEKLVREGFAPAGLKRLTLENMQARARGYLLMTLSNEFGWMLLSTGNKSEIGVGYATLYGDMCGGYNPLKDVYKTTVFALARWRNEHYGPGLLGPEGVAIPVEIIERPPSAELAPDQKDTDSLPPYEVLDDILEEMVENQLPRREILEQGFDPAVVARVYSLLKRAEYKRRQGAPGPKTTYRAFARDRRMPIVNAFDPSFIARLEELGREE